MKYTLPEGINILNATLLSKEEAENLLSPHELDCFWLKDKDKYGNIFYAVSGAVSSMSPDGGLALVRPALNIKIQNPKFKIDDTFYVGPYEFKILSDNIAWMHCHNLGPMYFQKNAKKECSYESSDVKRVIDNWYKSYCLKTESSIKAKELAEILMRNPDFEVKVMIQDPAEGWPCFNHYNIRIGNIGYSDKVIYLDAGTIPCKVGNTVYTVTGTNEEGYFVDKGNIISFCTEESGISFYVRFESGLTYWYSLSDLNKEVFLEEEKAEIYLTKLKEVI